jgi:RHS repeat-associated protein
VSSTVLDALGRIVSSQAGGLAPMAVSYDTRGRIVSVTSTSGAESRTISLVYDGNGYLQSITDPLGRSAQFDYDAAGRVVRKTSPDGQFVTFGYDASGNLATLTPPGRPAYTFAYSDRDEVVGITPPVVPGTGPTAQAYDLDGNPIVLSRPDGRTVTLGYDAAGRIVTRALAAGGVTTGSSTLSYDSVGRLASISAASGQSTGYVYDGFLPTAKTWSGDVAGSVSFTYDSGLRTASESVNGTSTAAFAYDPDDLLVTAGALTITHDAQNGLPIGSSLANVVTSVAYDGFGEPTSYNASASGSTFFAETFTYDAVGRVTAKNETIGGVTDNYAYTYDLAGQLTTVRRNGTTVESYVYDANGDRTAATVAGQAISATYDAQDRVVQYGTAAYTYNAAGELTATAAGGQSTSYQYDPLGNLLAVSLPSGKAITYVVDGRDRRVGKKVNGTLVQGFLYGGARRVVAELDGGGAVVSRFVFADRHVPAYMVKAGTSYRIITDQVGSVRLVVDAQTGAIAQRIDYNTFGNVVSDSNPGFQPFGFAGGLYDRDTGLVRFGARDYDAATGRWTTKDPSGFLGKDTNLYRYARNDPVNGLDPSGLGTAVDAIVGVAAGVYDLFTFRFYTPDVPQPPPVVFPNGQRFQPVVPTGNLVTDWANLINSWLDAPAVNTSSFAYEAGSVCGSVVPELGFAAAGRAALRAAEEAAAREQRNLQRLAEAGAKQIDFGALQRAADERRILDAADRAARNARDAADKALNSITSTGGRGGGGGNPFGATGKGGW